MRATTLAAKKAGYIPYFYLLYGLSKYTDFELMGTAIWAKDWDVLLVLDACRYDVFADMYGSDQRFEIDAMLSTGSASPEWMLNNFGRQYADEMARTAYVTGNPYSSNCPCHDRFDHVEEVWDYRWDDTNGTVLPAALSDEAIRVWDEIDPERMIVHYMQPHKPYLPAGDDVPMEESDFTLNLIKVFAARALGTYPQFKKAAARRNEISDERLRNLYRQNLAHVIESIDRTILPRLNADIVISSDHGELLGEHGIYHHPGFTRYAELRTVPWVAVDVSDADQYTPRPRRETRDRASVEEKLEDLGYRSSG